MYGMSSAIKNIMNFLVHSSHMQTATQLTQAAMRYSARPQAV